MNLPLVLEKNTTPQNWNARREALLALFRSQEYGIRPEVPYEQTERLRSEEYLPKCKSHTADLGYLSENEAGKSGIPRGAGASGGNAEGPGSPVPLQSRKDSLSRAENGA